MPDAAGSTEASASESRVRRDTGASGTGMLSSLRSISALGAAPVCAGTPVPGGATVRVASAAVRAVWNPVFAPEAPAVATSMTASLAEATTTSPAGAGAAAMVA